MPVDVAVIRRRLRALERYVRIMRGLREAGREAFLHDDAIQDRVQRNAHLAAQACAEIALHMVAAAGSAAPETYADAFPALTALGVISVELADRLANAARLRNILVHDYLDVDHGRLYDELGWIEDVVVFVERIDEWLEKNAGR